MTSKREGSLLFNFLGDSWSCIEKFDEHVDYKKLLAVQSNIRGGNCNPKAVDFVGINNNDVYLIEVKDFRAVTTHTPEQLYETEMRLHEEEDPISVELAFKVKDSLAAIIGGARNSTNHQACWQSFIRHSINSNREIIVIAWLEIPPRLAQVVNNQVRSGRKKGKKRDLKIQLKASLKAKLKWLTNAVYILQMGQTHKFENILQVENIPPPAAN